MAWVRIDDQFVEHRRVAALSDRAFRLYMIGLCYCARNLTDGRLGERETRVICAILDAPRPRQTVAELVRAGLWIEREEGAYEIANYLDYNPDSETVKAKREQRKAAGRAGAMARWHGGSHGEPHMQPHMPPTPTPKAKELLKPVLDGSEKIVEFRSGLLKDMPA